MLAAVEETDEGGIVLSAKERHEASREAGSPLAANPGRRARVTGPAQEPKPRAEFSEAMNGPVVVEQAL